ncbi:unnamed protein product [Orchesella dallaii]|uniref:AMMECR1 domain-containing protein n=1 Tax=Orchesella dallaii TaxID=48710 RepID=A0ABP1QD92_9HEXA
MASGCCGTKKQKLNNSQAASCPTMNGHSHTNGYGSSSRNNHDLYAEHNGHTNGHGPMTNGHTNGHGPHQNGMVLPLKNGIIPSPYADRIACPEMCFFCFDVLYGSLHNLEPPKAPSFTNEAFPLFVTWKIGKDHRLRGCMGTFNALNLHSGLREYAMTSAFKDSRFPPISRDEFNKLQCSVSILRHFEEGNDYLDWQVGVHGIRIEFHNERGSKRTATYLPEVAPEQGWNQTQTIDSLLRKGGFKGNVTPEVRASIKLTRYQSEKVSACYADYASRWQTNGVSRPL